MCLKSIIRARMVMGNARVDAQFFSIRPGRRSGPVALWMLRAANNCRVHLGRKRTKFVCWLEGGSV